MPSIKPGLICAKFDLLKINKGVSMACSEKNKRHRLAIRAKATQATPEHERRIKTAIQLLLAEWVQKRLAEGDNHVQQCR
jgi:hypothetical protein